MQRVPCHGSVHNDNYDYINIDIEPLMSNTFKCHKH